MQRQPVRAPARNTVRRPISFAKLVKRVADKFGTQVAADWTAAVLKHTRKINEAALQAALTQNDLAAVERVVGVSQMQAAVRAAITPALLSAIQGAGSGSAQTLSAHGVSMQFDAAHPNVIHYARTQAAELVRDVPKQTKQVIAEVVARGAEGKLTVVEQARAIRQVVGLAPSMADAPAAFAAELQAGQIAAATDRRISAVLAQKIRSRAQQGTLDAAFIQAAQEEYTAALINYRALTIARTESHASANFGLTDSWRQAVQAGDLPSTARRYWIVTPDDRLSPEHARIPGMNASGRGMNEPFMTTEGPCMYPPSRPNCRCSVGLGFDASALPDVSSADVPTSGATVDEVGVGGGGISSAPSALPDVGPLASRGLGGGGALDRYATFEYKKAAVDQVLAKLNIDPDVVKYTKFAKARGGEGQLLGIYSKGKIKLDPTTPIGVLRQTAAHEATHYQFDVAVHSSRQIQDVLFDDWKKLQREDGVTAYSRQHWSRFTELEKKSASKAPAWASAKNVINVAELRVAVEETLAEMRAMAEAGKKVGSPLYKKLLRMVDQEYRAQNVEDTALPDVPLQSELFNGSVIYTTKEVVAYFDDHGFSVPGAFATWKKVWPRGKGLRIYSIPNGALVHRHG